MSVTLEDWRRLYKICDHRERLHHDELDLFVERPGSLARTICEDLRDQFDEQGKWLLCGSVGAGKSSELLHLYQLLAGEYLVIGVDLQGATGDRLDTLSAAEVLLSIGAAAVRTGKQRSGHAVAPALVEELSAAFQGLVEPGRELDVLEFIESVALFGAEVVAPGVGSIVGAAARAVRAVAGSVNLSLRGKVGGLTRPIEEGHPSLLRLIAAVDAILGDIEQGVRAPLVLIDGLDKVTELASIHRLFAMARTLAQPAAPLIYTAPITLMLSTEWNAAENYFKRSRMTNLVVAAPQTGRHQVDEALIAAGRASIREVLFRRCKKAGLALETCLSPDGVELFISKSGGLLRQAIWLLRTAAREAGRARAPRIELDLAREVCATLRKEFEITLTRERREALEYIAAHGEAPGDETSHQLLRWGYALPYTNGEVWFAPNPLIDMIRQRP